MVTSRKIALINGPNLNLLGERETEIYGEISLPEIVAKVAQVAEDEGLEIWPVQSNHEGELVEAIHQAGAECDGIIINPAAYTHTSVAIHDALVAAGVPVIEVHMSNVYSREEFRQTSLVSPIADGVIIGLGPSGYTLAVSAIAEIFTAIEADS